MEFVFLLAAVNAIDIDAFRAVNAGLSHPILDPLMALLSASLTWWVATAALLIFALVTRRRSLLVSMLVVGIAVGIGDAFAFQILKPTFARERPCHQLEEVRLRNDKCGGDYGFPSNHATNGMAAATVLMIRRRGDRWAVLLLVTAIVVGFTRIYLGVHFPGDILAGFVVGGLCGSLVQMAATRLIPSSWTAPKSVGS